MSQAPLLDDDSGLCGFVYGGDQHRQDRACTWVAVPYVDAKAGELLFRHKVISFLEAELRFVQRCFDEALTVTDDVLAEFGERTDFDSISGLYHLRGSIFAHRCDLEASVLLDRG